MPDKGRILFIDNDRDFLDARAELLEKSGFTVIKAYTLDEARHALENDYVHLAILDIRMQDEDDERDESGLRLAEDSKYRSIPKIILTAFATVKYTRQALRIQSDGSRYVYDVLAKEDSDNFISEIQHIIDEHVGINWELAIYFAKNGPLSYRHLVSLFTTGAILYGIPDLDLQLEDLLRKLFSQYRQITLSEILWWQPGKVALKVYAFNQDGCKPIIVWLGDKYEIQESQKSYLEAQKSAQGQLQLQKEFSSVTLHLVAEAGSLTGVDLQGVKSFRSFFNESSYKDIPNPIENLICTTFAQWYQIDSRDVGRSEVISAYQGLLRLDQENFNPQEFKQKMQSIITDRITKGLVRIELTDRRMKFQFVSMPGSESRTPEDCPNPLAWLDDQIQSIDIDCTLRKGFPNLDLNTILVDASEQTWMTDFPVLMHIPAFYPILALECFVRFDLNNNNNLRSRYDFEKRLLTNHCLAESIPASDVEPELRKLIAAILALRQAAARTFRDDLLSYYFGLLLFTIHELITNNLAIQRTELETIELVHRLLLAGLLCEKINSIMEDPEGVNDSFAYGEFVIDKDNAEVMIGKQLIHLTEIEYKLLLYLYERAGQVCKRSEIVRHVWGINDPTRNDVNSLLNSNLNRTRKKIEPIRGEEHYLITQRGKGIVLITQPE